ncbi:MAG TPA: winged helix-turn-helix transcriptional regulator [Dehalococcoidia bacterium]|nr:winged helix-turn-helix transcriptional regulator [Dehalococcoidia bacterium]
MQSTKSQILAHLKRNGRGSIEELAKALGLAPMTVRQHLTALERDGLISSQEVRRSTGRPHLAFSLAEKAQEEIFPKRYDRLANLLFDEIASLEPSEIAGLSPKEKKRLLLSKMGERVARQHAPRLEGKPLPERVQLVATILESEGGMAEWRKAEAGFEIIDYNCTYRKIAQSNNEVCDWHLNLLGRLLGRQVRCNQYISQGDDSCRFLVDETDERALSPVKDSEV